MSAPAFVAAGDHNIEHLTPQVYRHIGEINGSLRIAAGVKIHFGAPEQARELAEALTGLAGLMEAAIAADLDARIAQAAPLDSRRAARKAGA